MNQNNRPANAAGQAHRERVADAMDRHVARVRRARGDTSDVGARLGALMREIWPRLGTAARARVVAWALLEIDDPRATVLLDAVAEVVRGLDAPHGGEP